MNYSACVCTIMALLTVPQGKGGATSTLDDYRVAYTLSNSSPMIVSHIHSLLNAKHLKYDLEHGVIPTIWAPPAVVKTIQETLNADWRFRLLRQTDFAGIQWSLNQSPTALLKEKRNPQITAVLQSDDYKGTVRGAAFVNIIDARLKDYEYLERPGVLSVGYRVQLRIDDKARSGQMLLVFDITGDVVRLIGGKRIPRRIARQERLTSDVHLL